MFLAGKATAEIILNIVILLLKKVGKGGRERLTSYQPKIGAPQYQHKENKKI